ncbi:4'-phosphopantetheinyl transferase family protein [Primorskyibacter sp. S187A]|uniref:4'-phosphopantetheinyl transferase family protein n=1 Tax=Primorskyibacter sp. S187A TaxID=3415130 RepID=UPI003C7D4E2A
MQDCAPFLHDLHIRPCGDGWLATAGFDPEHLHAAALPVSLPDRLRGAVLKRQAEFLAGRTLCFLLQKHMGLAPTAVHIGAGRAPVWPSGLAGSISHSNNQVAVLLFCRTDLFIGLDIEAIATERALSAIRSSVLNSAEVSLLEHNPEKMTAAFSAKETLYKALCAHAGRFFGFSAAHVVRLTQECITLSLQENLGRSFLANDHIDIHWRIAPPGVQTWVALSPRIKNR